jgi:2-polyprenyl-6-methoxyphenol hydroxylase-like FAD-dependent oxidoreductase
LERSDLTLECDVAIVGGGPAGLTLAVELGRRNLRCLVLDLKPGTTIHPQANATQARTMEHFRRLGFADEIRAEGLPGDYPTDVAYFTRFSRHEITRLPMPTAAEAQRLARDSTGSWSTPELPHRCSQLFIEPILRRHAEKFPSVQTRFGWLVEGLAQDARGVTLEARRADERLTVRCSYAVGCDGARSTLRRLLGIPMVGESQIVREFMGGKVHATYFRAPQLYQIMGGRKAWMYFAFNGDRRSVMMALNGTDTFVFHAQLKPGDPQDDVSDAMAQAMFEGALGAPCAIEKISASTWHAGHVLVAERYASGRVFLAGDAAHLFTPTGGLGYNTAIDDVANLGWKLGAVVRGWAAPALLDTYDAERHPIGLRNTGLARRFADQIGHFKPEPGVEDPGAAGDEARARRRVPVAAPAARIQHPGDHVRRALRGLSHRRRRRQRSPCRRDQHLRGDRQPGRQGAALVAARRPIAVRHLRPRVQPARLARGPGHRTVSSRRRGTGDSARDRQPAACRAACPLRRRPRADSSGSPCRLARQRQRRPGSAARARDRRLDLTAPLAAGDESTAALRLVRARRDARSIPIDRAGARCVHCHSPRVIAMQ